MDRISSRDRYKPLNRAHGVCGNFTDFYVQLRGKPLSFLRYELNLNH